jgi:hypothetical protein
VCRIRLKLKDTNSAYNDYNNQYRKLVMLVHHIHKALFATAISSLLPPAAAQNASSINRTECYGNMGSFDSNASVNSTGKVKFQFDNNDTNYYLSVTNNDSRSESTEFVKFIPEVRHDYQGWLSYPNDTTVLACIYELSAINASSPDGGMNGCEGVLSTACISELVKVRLPAGSDSNTRCPSFQATDSVKELCGGLTGRLFTSELIRTLCRSINLCSVVSKIRILTLRYSQRKRSIQSKLLHILAARDIRAR